MKFTNNANANMTGLRGEFSITYAELVEIFGPPKYGPNADLDKTSCEWALQFEDGTVATIYDWKVGRWTIMGEYDWHIGGHDDKALTHVVDTIVLHRDRLVRMVREYQPL